tara:strand:+ start:1021 stop:1578 length:558 start_codon:yes stop_codon:yes gene_type:complete
MFNNIFNSYLYRKPFNLDVNLLENKILKIKDTDPGSTISNYGGWHSKSFEKIDKSFKDLFKEINKIVLQIEKKLEIVKPIKLHNYWLNINKFGSFNRPHCHFGPVVSGVYYIKTPPSCGNIVFTQPHNINDFYGLPKKFNEYNSSTFSEVPHENLCLLFPSYITHYVEPNLNKKNRISISFNYGF